MTYYDEKLKALQEKISRSRQLTSMLKELRGQRDTIAARVRELEAIKVDAGIPCRICGDRVRGSSLFEFRIRVCGKREPYRNAENSKHPLCFMQVSAGKQIQSADTVDVYCRNIGALDV